MSWILDNELGSWLGWLLGQRGQFLIFTRSIPTQQISNIHSLWEKLANFGFFWGIPILPPCHTCRVPETAMAKNHPWKLSQLPPGFWGIPYVHYIRSFSSIHTLNPNLSQFWMVKSSYLLGKTQSLPKISNSFWCSFSDIFGQRATEQPVFHGLLAE